MAPQDTTVVFVPGAWHSPDGFDAVIAHLHKAGYNTSKVFTPTVLRNGGPLQTIEHDVAEIRKHLTKAIDAGQKVILAMHSYGGLPGSQATEGLDQASLATTQGHKDGRGVVHLVYLAAFMLRAGEVPPMADWIDFLDNGALFPKTPAHTFYNDFESQDEVDRWIATLNPWGVAPGGPGLTHEPWRTVPTTYLACEYDNALFIEWQREKIRYAVEQGAADLRTINWKCGHTPFAIDPLGVSLLIRSAVERVGSTPPTDVKSPSSVAVEAVEVAV